jgi:hypothetical protein
MLCAFVLVALLAVAHGAAPAEQQTIKQTAAMLSKQLKVSTGASFNNEIRGRSLATEGAFCSFMGSAITCAFKSPLGEVGCNDGCKWDSTDSSCGPNDAAGAAMASVFAPAILNLIVPALGCAVISDDSICTANANCTYSADVTVGCELSESVAMGAFGETDPAMGKFLAANGACKSHSTAAACNAKQGCEFDESNECTPPGVVLIIMLGNECPTLTSAIAKQASSDPDINLEAAGKANGVPVNAAFSAQITKEEAARIASGAASNKVTLLFASVAALTGFQLM